MRACWLKWVGRDWSISADYIWLNYSGANKHPDAKHFRELHGYSAHDLTPTLVSGVNQSYSVGDAVSVQAYTPPVDLPNELAIIDRHRLRIQNAYALFGNYATKLQRNYKSL